MKKNDQVIIFVATHKPGSIRHDNVYTPIHVGRAISKYKDEMADMIGDDTGDNISEKNSSYSEMTAHYWIWKNVHDVEYVGLCHYRRLFGVDITSENIEQIMRGYDVMMVNPAFQLDSVYSCFVKFIGGENMTIAAQVVKKLCPEYYDTLITLGNELKFHPFNMFVCKKEIHNRYAEWIFPILMECERHIEPSPYSNAYRVIGYIAEMITQLFFIHNDLKIKSVPYISVEEDGKMSMIKPSFGDTVRLKVQEFLLKTLHKRKRERDSRYKFTNPAFLAGLKKDGIEIM